MASGLLSTKKLARVFKALANGHRMWIIKYLAKKPSSVGEICNKLQLSFPATSFHLSKMEREGIIKKARKGKYILYRLSKPFKSSGISSQIIKSK